MKNLPLLFFLFLFLAFAVSAQTNPGSSCPQIDVSGGGIVEPGEPMSFTVNVKDYDTSNLIFNWVVSTGEILEGQGTITIRVLKPKDSRQHLTVTVDIEGLPEGCENNFSETEPIICPVPTSILFDEFGLVPNGDLKARIQNLYVELSNDSGVQGYVINYGTDREIARRERQFRDVIVTFLNLDASRVTLVNGGANQREKGVRTKVWIVPLGADNPTP